MSPTIVEPNLYWPFSKLTIITKSRLQKTKYKNRRMANKECIDSFFMIKELRHVVEIYIYISSNHEASEFNSIDIACSCREIFNRAVFGGVRRRENRRRAGVVFPSLITVHWSDVWNKRFKHKSFIVAHRQHLVSHIFVLQSTWRLLESMMLYC